MHLEIVIAALGGQGALTAGELLAIAGMQHGLNVTNTPVYSPEVRGGSSNAFVVLSTKPIGSMMANTPNQGIFLCRQGLERVAATLVDGARAVYNSTLIPPALMRTEGLETVAIPATELAEDVVGDVRTANMVALGAFTVLEPSVPLEWLIEALPTLLGARRMGFLDVNVAALRCGAGEAAKVVA